MSEELDAYYFDGRRSVAVPATVRVDGATLVVSGDTLDPAEWALADVGIAEQFAQTPRMVALPRGATLEVPDADGRFDTALRAQGVVPSAVQRMQRHRFAAVIVLVLCVALGAYAYVDGIPALARAVAMRVPLDVDQRLGARLLADADRGLFTTTRLSATRRAELDERFATAAKAAAPDVAYRVVWRQMVITNEPNAFTLPGGTIVMLDSLEGAVDDDDALVGVFGHELGHVAGRHTLRHMIQVGGVGGFASMIWGDMSSLLLNGAIVLSSLQYSRDMELEADAFGVRVLKASHLSVEPLIEFLSGLESRQTEQGRSPMPGLLQTHPLTDERIARLRAAMAQP